jgi:hypothetical protein
MKLIILAGIILLSSCANNHEITADRKLAIKKEMKAVNAFYYRKIDSLGRLKKTDTQSAKLHAIAEEIISFDQQRAAELLALQKKYDSLTAELR